MSLGGFLVRVISANAARLVTGWQCDHLACAPPAALASCVAAVVFNI